MRVWKLKCKIKAAARRQPAAPSPLGRLSRHARRASSSGRDARTGCTTGLLYLRDPRQRGRLSVSLPDEVLAFLRRHGLAAPDERPPACAVGRRILGHLARRSAHRPDRASSAPCPALRVAQVWEAPGRAQRATSGAGWRRANAIVPASRRQVLAGDDAGLLRHGVPRPGHAGLEGASCARSRATPHLAADVGAALAAIHDAHRAAPTSPPLSRPTRASMRCASSRTCSPLARVHASTFAKPVERARRANRADPACTGARRRQPEEHPRRPARSRYSSTRNAPGMAIPRSTSRSA